MRNLRNINLLSVVEDAELLPENRGLKIGNVCGRARKFKHEVKLKFP